MMDDSHLSVALLPPGMYCSFNLRLWQYSDSSDSTEQKRIVERLVTIGTMPQYSACTKGISCAFPTYVPSKR